MLTEIFYFAKYFKQGKEKTFLIVPYQTNEFNPVMSGVHKKVIHT